MPEPIVAPNGLAMKLASCPCDRATPLTARFSATMWSAAASGSATWPRLISNWPAPNSQITVSAGAPSATAARLIPAITGSKARITSMS